MNEEKYCKKVIGNEQCVTGVVVESSGENMVDIVFYEKDKGKGLHKGMHVTNIATGIRVDDIMTESDLDEFNNQVKGFIAKWRFNRGQSVSNTDYKIRNDLFGYIYN